MRKNPVFQHQMLGAALLKVRSGRATSRSLLAKELGISPSTVGLYVEKLIAEGFLSESGLKRGNMGRPRRLLKTCAEAGWFAGVEFSAERIQAVGVDFSGHTAAAGSRPLTSEVKADMVIEEILSCVETLSRSMKGPLLSVGLGIPGLVNIEAGVGLLYTFIPDWKDIPVSAMIRAKLGVPVILENNLRAIALAERWFGLGHDLGHYVILGPRSGFGVALVVDGVPLEGAHHAAGEIGRWPWPLSEGTGKSQELHHVLSAPATWRRLAEAGPQVKLPVDLRAALAEHAETKGRVWDEICADFARVIGCLQMIADTGVYILHGPLTALGTRFCDDIAASAHAMMPALSTAPLKIIPSILGDDAGALGAASLAMESWSPV